MTGASMDKIAAEAGVTKHTIYRRFASKEMLLDAVVGEEVARFANFSRLPIAPDRAPLDTLRALAQARFAYVMEPENVAWRAFLRAESAYSPTLLGKLAAWDQLAVRRFLDAIEAAQAEGRLCPGDPEAVCDILFSLIDGNERWWRWGGGDIPALRDRDRFIEERWEIFLRACGR